MEFLEKKAPFVSEVLKGVGQIMLQNSAWTGLLFLVGIFYDDLTMGIAAILASCVGTLTARLLNYDKTETAIGLYGFSATLVGVALTFLFKAELIIWVLVVVGSALAAMLQHFFISKRIPAFTFPFIVVTWIIVFLLHQYTAIQPPAALIDTAMIGSEINDFTSSTNGFGEVIFQGSFFAGVIFMIAVFVSNPVAALYGLAGSILGAWIAAFYAEPITDIHIGLFSFNAVLCAITFAGPNRKDGILVLIACVLSVLIDIYLLKGDFSILSKAGGVLTFPFVAATWLTLPIKRWVYQVAERINPNRNLV